MGKLRTLLLVLVGMFLLGCISGPGLVLEEEAAASLETAVVQVLTATAEAAQVLDLQSILVLPGDLPPSIVPGQLTTEGFKVDVATIGNPANKVSLDLHYLDAERKGYVQVLVYETPEEAESLYDLFEADLNDWIGYDRGFSMAEKGISVVQGSVTGLLNDFYGTNDKRTIIQKTVFLRCNTVVNVALILDSRDDTANVYAKRLDDRVVGFVCPNIPPENE